MKTKYEKLMQKCLNTAKKSNGENMPNRHAVRTHAGQLHPGIMHSGDVSVRDAPAFRVHPVQVRQLRQKERRLELVEPAVVALVDVVILVIGAVVAQGPDPRGQRLVVGH